MIWTESLNVGLCLQRIALHNWYYFGIISTATKLKRGEPVDAGSPAAGSHIHVGTMMLELCSTDPTQNMWSSEQNSKQNNAD